MPSEHDELGRKAPNGEHKVPSVAEQSLATNGTAKSNQVPKSEGQPADATKERELSGKEKKELAKAQKAAKRAAEKQKQQGQPAVDLVAGNNKDLSKDTSKKGPLGLAAPASKSQHKRTGSTSAGAQPSLPHRQAQPNVAPVLPEPQKENKNVAFFEHLYGHPRRSTIAGAGKDVHPSVLALGLQMRNYVICGSSARCVAMLLAFKRVCTIHKGDICITDPLTGD